MDVSKTEQLSGDKQIIRLIGGVASAAMITGSAWAFQDDGTIRIGSIETQTGAAASYGVQTRNGSRIAADEINAAGSVKVGGKNVKLSISPEPDGYDDGDNTVQTLALFKKAIFDDKVIAVKGITRSISVETLFNYLKEIDKQGAGTVLISPESSTPGLGGITPWGFRNAFFEANQIDREGWIVHRHHRDDSDPSHPRYKILVHLVHSHQPHIQGSISAIRKHSMYAFLPQYAQARLGEYVPHNKLGERGACDISQGTNVGTRHA